MAENTNQFSLKWLLLATLIVAWVLSINNWLSDGYGWRTAVACGIFGGMVALVDKRTATGALVGFMVMGIVGYFFIVGHRPPSLKFYKAMLIVVAYGGAVGSGVSAMLLKRPIVGGLASIIALVTFGAILWIN